MQWQREQFVLTNDRSSTSVEDTFQLLQSTYWSHTRPTEVVERIIDHSLCFFLLREDLQVGFGRVISDFTTLSWIADVVIDESCQNSGIGSWMMNCIMEHPELQGTQFVLQTATARKFYERLGFGCHESLMSTPVDYL